MKAKGARQILEPLQGDELYQQARKLYISEAGQLIQARCGTNPSAQAIEGALSQVSDWFRKATLGLNWGEEDYTERIIKWERGEFFLKYGVTDPVLTELGKRTRLNALKGTTLPMFEALTNDSLEAASSLMMASIRRDAVKASAVLEARRAYVAKLGKKECWFRTDARDCPHQETYVTEPEKLHGGMPTNVEELVFVCNVDECIREKRKEAT